MSRSKNETNLSKKLSFLIHPKPSFIESDDEDIVTIDKFKGSDNSDDSEGELSASRFRKQNLALLEEEDIKYSGKTVSRKDLTESTDSELKETDGGLNKTEIESLELGGENSQIRWHDEDEVSSESDTQLSDQINLEEDAEQVINKDKLILSDNIFSTASTASDIEKGLAIKNQIHIWDFLLECRMKFQKCLIASNQFPSFSNFLRFKNRGDSEFQESLIQTQKSLSQLLCSLMKLQEKLLLSNEEFQYLSNDIDVESEEKEKYSNFDKCDKFREIENKKHKNFSSISKLSDYSLEISKKHKNLKNYRNKVIQKWNDKTRIGNVNNKNFSAFEQSTLKQIEHVLLDKQRLIKRTQSKRSNYHILGEEEPSVKKLNLGNENLNSPNSVDMKSKTTKHKEIFDDDDFYHQLLSEFIKRKANDVTDPVQLGRQWMQLQKIRSKMKKNVDVKASKGRKVRFVVHQKLVNFMMPCNISQPIENSRTELLNSLFGQNYI